ncbi:fungal-specific transcription factor domain-containing protein [Biscogniauxia marginata]|nr:fungal-specific transcription factor domain-containing protein [Biscogniauxia marginata]
MASQQFGDLFQHDTGHGASSSIGLTTAEQVSMGSFLSNPPSRGDTEDLTGPQTAANETTTKKLACNPCRDRKVRCDREQPTCSRCSKLGLECIYSSPSRQPISKSDLTRLLLSLHDRVGRAESQLASSSRPDRTLPPSPGGPPGPCADFNPFRLTFSQMQEDPILQTHVPDGILAPSVALPSATSQWSCTQAGSPFDSMFSGAEQSNFISLAQPSNDVFMFDGSDSIDLSSITWSSNNSPSLEEVVKEAFTSSSYGNPSNQSTTLLPSTLSNLHVAYFEVFDPVIPMINRSRFYSELAHSHASIHVQALSHAVGALGALAVPEPMHIAETSYIQARNLLDMCEREESGTMLSNINVLQTCILLVFYELKKPKFARAWLTLGRAIRLSKIMGLEYGDVDEGTTSARSNSFTPLPVPSTPVEIEERRRTFWQLYILDALPDMGISWGTMFDDIFVRLPQTGTINDVGKVPEMPTLDDLLESTENYCISPFASVVIVAYLHRRCLSHLHMSLRDPFYSFWDNYYQLEKLIARSRNGVLAEYSEGDGEMPSDPLRLLSSINIAAVEISLSEAVIAKVDSEMLQNTLLAEAMSKCISAFSRVVEGVRKGMNHAGIRSSFKQSSALFARALVTTIQTDLRTLCHRRVADQSTHINGLRLLSEAMRELVSPMFIPPGLLEQVDAEVDAEQQPSKRNRL